jgi:23S rRNA pseudouridine1911/1915/1917 synthase
VEETRDTSASLRGARADEDRAFDVEPAEVGRRLDLFLAERLELSRAQARRLLSRGAVHVGGRAVVLADKGMPLSAGETVRVAPFTQPGAQRAVPEPDLSLRVLAEGPGWLAVDKPAGMPVHPLVEDERGTILNALVARHPEIHGVGEGGLRSGVVHRLDVETSGVLLLATREAAWRRLREAFAAHRVEKVYRAIVLGALEGSGSIEVPLLLARHRPARVRVARDHELARARGVRHCALSWRLLEPLDGATLVEVRPVSGFLHQIRVTLAHLGHPLAGDRTYGPPRDATGAERHLLHAARVAYEEVEASCPDADDFARVLTALRRNDAGVVRDRSRP